MNGMRGMTRLILAGLSVALLSGSPQRAAAGPPRELVTVLVDVITPAGTAVVGTLAVLRGCTAETSAEYLFNGTINGRPAYADATGIERWGRDGHADITITAVRDWHIDGSQPTILTIGVLQTAPGLLAVNGVPLAVDQLLQAPCSGPTTYTVRNAGAGQLSILTLPNTGAGSDLALLVAPGTAEETPALAGVGLLVGLSSLLALVPVLRRRAGRRGGI